MIPEPTSLLRVARLRAGLSQRQLARRAGTAQSVVARIEGGQTSPSWETLSRLIFATGFEVEARLLIRPAEGSHMLDDVGRILRLTPEQRLTELRNAARFVAEARRV
ncbi:MAG TPA: helix-turn-helix transcriptional regulator [Gemmatimonadales bacterium]